MNMTVLFDIKKKKKKKKQKVKALITKAALLPGPNMTVDHMLVNSHYMTVTMCPIVIKKKGSSKPLETNGIIKGHMTVL